MRTLRSKKVPRLGCHEHEKASSLKFEVASSSRMFLRPASTNMAQLALWLLHTLSSLPGGLDPRDSEIWLGYHHRSKDWSILLVPDIFLINRNQLPDHLPWDLSVLCPREFYKHYRIHHVSWSKTEWLNAKMPPVWSRITLRMHNSSR